VGDLVSKVGLGDFLHVREDHGANLLWGEDASGGADLDLDRGLARLVHNLEGIVLHIPLNFGIFEVPSDEALGVLFVPRQKEPRRPEKNSKTDKDGLLGVLSSLVLGGVTDKTLAAVWLESDSGRGDTVALRVGEDFDAALLLHAGQGD
jgi:hypothetical protein